MNDQKAKGDAGKPKLSLVPRRIIFDIARIREYGNNKYPEGGPDNWKQVEPERYRDAAFRHFLAYLDDPYGVDSESGLPHLWHLACNIAFLCELENNEKLTCKKIEENPDGSVTFRVKREGMKVLGFDNGPTLSDEELDRIPAEPDFTKWFKAWREHEGEAEYYRKNMLTGKVQFGDYDFESGSIIPRKGPKYD